MTKADEVHRLNVIKNVADLDCLISLAKVSEFFGGEYYFKFFIDCR